MRFRFRGPFFAELTKTNQVQKRLAIRKQTAGDNLAEYRERIMYLLGISSILVAMPLAVFNIFKGELLLGYSTIAVFSILALNSLAIYRKIHERSLIPLFIIGLLCVIWISFAHRGIMGVFWEYPAVLFISFVFSHKTAKIYLGILFVYVSALTFYYLDTQIAIRSTMGLILTITFTNIFLNIIYHLRTTLLLKSISDPLTGALNRSELSFSLDSAIERKSRSGESAALLMLDIDNFKSINDVYGHATGDHVIKEVVSLITNRARKLDQLFRLGGDEFMLILPMTNGSDAKVVANGICEMIAGAELIDGKQVTVSIGVSELGNSLTEKEWLQRADSALYEAKGSGRNRAVRWQPVVENVSEAQQENGSFSKAMPAFIS